MWILITAGSAQAVIFYDTSKTIRITRTDGNWVYVKKSEFSRYNLSVDIGTKARIYMITSYAGKQVKLKLGDAVLEASNKNEYLFKLNRFDLKLNQNVFLVVGVEKPGTVAAPPETTVEKSSPARPRQPRKPVRFVGATSSVTREVSLRILRIDDLLRKADADIKANRLTLPTGNNALERYRMVLKLDPSNEVARKGLQRIVASYIKLAELRIKSRDWKKAASFLDRAEKVIPGDSKIMAIRKKLQALVIKSAKLDPRKRFIKAKSGIITDRKTGLQWFVGPDRDFNWNVSKNWVERLSVGGWGWRMPKLSELRGLYQRGSGARNIYHFFKTTGWLVWSGKTSGPSHMWYFNFKEAKEVLGTKYSEESLRVFAVRKKR